MSERPSDEQYDLGTIEATCLKLGLHYRRVSDDEIEATIAPSTILGFANTDDCTDTYLGFRDLPWHSHGRLVLMTGEATYVEYDPSELLHNIISGHVVVVTQYLKGQLTDRWLADPDEKIDVGYIEADEEIRIYRVGDHTVFGGLE